MSGGSFNYLCHADARGLFDKMDDVQRMADTLAARGAKDAAIETESVLLVLNQFEVRMQARLARLQGVWKAIEWLHSGDWSDDQVEAELASYREEMAK